MALDGSKMTPVQSGDQSGSHYKLCPKPAESSSNVVARKAVRVVNVRSRHCHTHRCANASAKPEGMSAFCTTEAHFALPCSEHRNHHGGRVNGRLDRLSDPRIER